MSESPRKLIRNAVVALLATPVGDPPAPPTVAGDRVYGNRTSALATKDMPALAVYVLAERPSPDWNNANQERSLKLFIEPHHDFKVEGGDELDEFVWAVERTILDSKDLGLPEGGPVDIREINWQGTTLTIKTPEGLIPGVGTVEVEIKYLWVRPEAEMDLAPFLRIHGDQLGRPPEEGGDHVEIHAELPQE